MRQPDATDAADPHVKRALGPGLGGVEGEAGGPPEAVGVKKPQASQRDAAGVGGHYTVEEPFDQGPSDSLTSSGRDDRDLKNPHLRPRKRSVVKKARPLSPHPGEQNLAARYLLTQRLPGKEAQSRGVRLLLLDDKREVGKSSGNNGGI